jgi:hypothetical protein
VEENPLLVPSGFDENLYTSNDREVVRHRRILSKELGVR